MPGALPTRLCDTTNDCESSRHAFWASNRNVRQAARPAEEPGTPELRPWEPTSSKALDWSITRLLCHWKRGAAVPSWPPEFMSEDTGRVGCGVLPHGNVARSAAVILLLALGLVVLGTGCATSKASVSNRMASIVVTNVSSEQIAAAVNTVFKKHSFEEGKAEEDELVFQRPGSFMSGLVYGDWYSGGVWERVKVYQRELDAGRTVVECDGYMVQEHDDPMFQNEKREYKTKKGHLRDLLNEVAKELKHPLPPAAPAQSK